MLIVFAFLTGIFLTLLASLIAMILGVFPTELEMRAITYQPLLAGALGGYAAIIAASGIYAATTKRILSDRAERTRIEIAQRGASAMVLMVALNSIREQLLAARHHENRVSQIAKPDKLTEIETIRYQSPETKFQISRIIAEIDKLNRKIVYPESDLYGSSLEEDQQDLIEHIRKTSLDLCNFIPTMLDTKEERLKFVAAFNTWFYGNPEGRNEVDNWDDENRQ